MKPLTPEEMHELRGKLAVLDISVDKQEEFIRIIDNFAASVADQAHDLHPIRFSLTRKANYSFADVDACATVRTSHRIERKSLQGEDAITPAISAHPPRSRHEPAGAPYPDQLALCRICRERDMERVVAQGLSRWPDLAGNLPTQSGALVRQAVRASPRRYPCRLPAQGLREMRRLRSSDDRELDQGQERHLPILCLPSSWLRPLRQVR